jgi:hypothetical protein
MKITILSRSLYSATVALVLALSASAQPSTSHGKMTREDEIIVTMTAKVEALDLDKRELTLKDSRGETVTVIVDKAVKRLNEVKVGDDVTAKYYMSVAAELREPTPEEKANPLTVTAGVAKTPEGAAPGAAGLNMIRVVATVEGLERPTRKVTLKGPRGNYLSVRARDPQRLEKLHLGDTVVVTVTEAVAISVDKAKKD